MHNIAQTVFCIAFFYFVTLYFVFMTLTSIPESRQPTNWQKSRPCQYNWRTT